MNIRRKIWWLLPLLCLCAGAALSILLSATGNFHWSFSIKEGFVFGGMLTLHSSIAFILIRSYPTKVAILGYAVAVGSLTGITAAWLHSLTLSWLLLPAEAAHYESWIKSMELLRWTLYPAALLLFCITASLYRRMDEIEGRYRLQQDATALLKEAELFRLRQQLQPHFLYNSLNAVSALILISPDQAGEMINRLSDFLRASVRQGKSELVPLEEELDYLRNYLWIEAVRFGDRLEIVWDVNIATAGTSMPPFLLQPLMENAVRFGVYGRTGAVTIHVSADMHGGILTITIRNPYDATMSAGSGTGFGLEGVRRRLYLMYARLDLLQTTERDGYFSTTIQIPQ